MDAEIDKRLAVHEAVCAERYRIIQEHLTAGEKRMTKIEYLLYTVMALVLLGPGVAASFAHKLFGF